MTSKEDEEYLKEALKDKEIIAFLPYAAKLRDADRDAVCVYDCMDGETKDEIDKILRRISE